MSRREADPTEGATDLDLMPHLGPISAARLRAVGVRTQANLRELGAVGAYVELKRGFPAETTQVSLYDLHFWQNGSANGSSGGVTVSGNTAITSASQIPASIVNNAGLEPAFKGILNWHPAG